MRGDAFVTSELSRDCADADADIPFCELLISISNLSKYQFLIDALLLELAWFGEVLLVTSCHVHGVTTPHSVKPAALCQQNL